MIGVRSNRSTRSDSSPSAVRSSRTGMFERATRSFGTTSVMSKVALMAGSSQHGKQRRASVASNCVTPAYRSSPVAEKYLLRSPVNSTAREAPPGGISVPNTKQAVSWSASNCMSWAASVCSPNVTVALPIFRSSAFSVTRSVAVLIWKGREKNERNEVRTVVVLAGGAIAALDKRNVHNRAQINPEPVLRFGPRDAVVAVLADGDILNSLVSDTSLMLLPLFVVVAMLRQCARTERFRRMVEGCRGFTEPVAYGRIRLCLSRPMKFRCLADDADDTTAVNVVTGRASACELEITKQPLLGCHEAAAQRRRTHAAEGVFRSRSSRKRCCHADEVGRGDVTDDDGVKMHCFTTTEPLPRPII
uniref:Uncharacterized protein n=1 Tax=Anopheles farauti TaxID=69004 RepID=A0A182QAY0_9DIPT